MSGDISESDPGLTPPHQKCDARQPCTTCVDKDAVVKCMYVPLQPSRPRGADVFLVPRGGASDPPGISASPHQTPADGFSFHEPQIDPRSNPAVLARSESSEAASSLSVSLPLCERRPLKSTVRLSPELSSLLHDEIVPSPLSDISIVYDVKECASHPVKSPFTILPSVNFSTIPRLLQMPFPLIPPERVQVSCLSGSDLDMTLCVFGLLLSLCD